ncbi:hypothetical protein [Nocardia carnea]|uniref:hypothetical protein n=1 Tax=Nocardia carnea TaxID=37328 RepID=UPI00245745CE|nr:hypothetical protein [Nocardia carnea]
MVIVTVDGAVSVEVKEPDGMFGKVIAALPGLFADAPQGTEQIADAIWRRYSDHVTIEQRQITGPDGHE